MAANFPTDREDLNPALPAGALQNGDTTTIGGITYTFNTPGDYWTAVGGDGDEYELPVATDVILGGIKVGSRLSITEDGTLSADIQGGGGATVGSLQEVTDVGNTTDNSIVVGAGGYGTAADGTTILPGYLRLTGATGTPLNIYKTDDTEPVIKFGVDGSATFAAGQTTISNSGAVVVERNSSGVVFRSGEVGETPTCEIISDGSANFGGLVTVDIPADNTGFLLSVSGTAKGSFGTNVNDFIVGNPIAGDGTISFQTKPASGPPTNKAHVTNDGNMLIGGTLPASPNISLNGDGSASFAGQVGIGGTLPASPNIKLNANGRIETVFDGKFRLGVGETGASGSTNSFGQVAHTFNGFDGYTTYSDPDGNETARITCTDGSASFVGVVQSGGSPDNGALAGTALKAGGRVVVSNSGGTNTVFQGFTTGTSTATSEIFANGSATFVGNVQSGGDAVGGAAAGATLASNGRISVARSASGSPIFSGYTAGSSTITSQINADGSATFVGPVLTGTTWDNDDVSGIRLAVGSDSGTVLVKGKSGTNDAFSVRAGGNTSAATTASIKMDGTADFSGKVTCAVLNSGVATFTRSSGGAAAEVVKVNDGTADTIVFKRDGSADFKGNGNATNNSLGINGLGLLSIRKDTGTDTAINVYSGGQTASDITFKVQADGSAEFAEDNVNVTSDGVRCRLAAGVLPSPSISGSYYGPNSLMISNNSTSPGSTYILEGFSTNLGVRTCYITGDGVGAFDTTRSNGFLVNLDPTNPANFNAEGEYTGPTLDVKDRLTKANAALTAIKTAAADSNTDLAGLKAAIVSALADF